jgi:hypothetical protein
MPKPHIVYRYPESKKYIPVGHTVLGELVEQGLLKAVPLTPSGRAKAITQDSIIEYQRDVMGLEPQADDAPETAPRIADRAELERAEREARRGPPNRTDT